MPRLKRGALLKTNKYIRCNIPGFQFDKGKLVKYVAAYKDTYLVEFADRSYMPTIIGNGGCVLAIKKKDLTVI